MQTVNEKSHIVVIKNDENGKAQQFSLNQVKPYAGHTCDTSFVCVLHNALSKYMENLMTDIGTGLTEVINKTDPRAGGP